MHGDDERGQDGTTDAESGGPTDMTADNIAPEDVPTPDPANTELPAHGETNQEDHQ